MCEKLCEREIGARATPHLSPFPNLRKLHIHYWRSIKTGIGSPSIITSLVHLEMLWILHCEKMKQVISEEEIEDETEISSNILTFPKLHHLQLDDLDELECMYGGSYKVEFPALKRLVLQGNYCMTRFVGPTNTVGFLPEKVEFPCLEKLDLRGTPIAAPSINFYSLFQNLRTLELAELKWKHAFSKDMVAIIGLTLLNHLEQLSIRWCEDMVEVVEEIDDGTITPSSSSLNLEFPRLMGIDLYECDNMRWFFSAAHAQIVLHLPSLQQVSIYKCNNMELFSNVPIKAPKLAYVQVLRFDYEEVEMDKGDDINNFLSGIYKSWIRKGEWRHAPCFVSSLLAKHYSIAAAVVHTTLEDIQHGVIHCFGQFLRCISIFLCLLILSHSSNP